MTNKEQMSLNKFVYSLGCGCWIYNECPLNLRSPSIFRGTSTWSTTQFPPLLLFNGTLEKEFKNGQNWKAKLSDFSNKPQFNAILDINVQNIVLEMTWHHLQWQSASMFKNAYVNGDEYFGFFNKYKYFQLFIIDCVYYNLYSNFDISYFLEFEKFLENNNFDLHNFVYLFKKGNDYINQLKIKSFCYDVDENLSPIEKQRYAPLRFYTEEINYITKNVERIKTNYENSIKSDV